MPFIELLVKQRWINFHSKIKRRHFFLRLLRLSSLKASYTTLREETSILLHNDPFHQSLRFAFIRTKFKPIDREATHEHS